MDKLTTRAGRAIARCLPLLLLATSIFWIGLQERALWQRAPADTLDRYALDRLLPEVPARVELEELWLLCNGRGWSHLWRSRSALASCLADTPATGDSEELAGLEQRWRNHIEQQLHFAQQVFTLAPTELAYEIERARSIHRQLQDHAGGFLVRTLIHLGVTIPWARLSHVIDQADLADSTPLHVAYQSSRQATQNRLAKIDRGDDPWIRARDIGLLAAGLQLDHEYARAVPQPDLVSDKSVLAEKLEWARRTQPRSGNVLEETLTGWLDMLSLSAALAVALAIALRARPYLVATVFLLGMVGNLHLLDVSLTGPVALRYLPIRNLGEGFWHTWGLGSSQLGGAYFWGPALAFMVSLAFSRALSDSTWLDRKSERILRYPLPAWGRFLLAGLAITLLAPIGSASKTELLGSWAAIASALFISRYAPLIRHGIKPAALAAYGAPVVAAALLASIFGGLIRMDLGAVGIALLITGIVVVVLARSHFIRFVLAGLIVAGLGLYSTYLRTGEDISGLIGLLPTHAGLRFQAAQDAAHHGAPDVQQVQWLLRSAQRPGELGAGWGLGNVPWQGLPGSSGAHTLPLPAVSDLALVLPAASGGLLYALALVGLLGGILINLVGKGYVRALEDKVPLTRRFLASFAAFGLSIALLRVILNLGGTLQVLPLTGVPLVFLAHAPAASTFALMYVGVLLGALPKKAEDTSPYARHGR